MGTGNAVCSKARRNSMISHLRGILLIVLLTLEMSAGAQSRTPQSDLPRVDATKTTVSLLNAAVGYGLALFAPTAFGEYWPDYGYSWGKARGGTGCESLNQKQRSADVGGVSLIAPSSDDSDRYVGIELTNRISSDIGTAASRGVGSDTLTLQQLCRWLGNSNLTEQIENVLGSNGGSNLWLVTEHALPNPNLTIGTRFSQR